MPPFPKPGRKATLAAGGAQRQQQYPRLNAEMACDTAFRAIAGRCLGNLTANHEATRRGNPGALHQMRIALTRLRTAILFFSPMVADSERTRIREELKWLNAHLGAVRDLDVAIERLKQANKRGPHAISDFRSWDVKRADSQRQLARALRSARYRRLIESTSGWIENGPWSITGGKQATKERAGPLAGYGAGKLARWREKLLKKCRRVGNMGTEKRHRLRLLNKRLSYSIEFLEDLFPDKRFSGQQAALKYLRKAQRSLGQLNDAVNFQSLATALEQDGVPAPIQFLSPKREKRLLKTATAAYRKLAGIGRP